MTCLQGIVKTLLSRTSATSTTLASSANPSVTGARITYTATVSPAPNGGTVTFSDGTATITGCGSAPVDTSTGEAICQVTYTRVGSHTITAAYSGDSEFKVSTSAPLIQTVNKATPALGISQSANPVIVGGPAHGTATLASTDAGGAVDYRYYDNLAACQADIAAFPGTAPTRGTDAGTVIVSGGSVPDSAPATFGSAGTIYWAAFYSGDAANAGAATYCDAQQVTYQVQLLYDQAKANHSGSTVPIELQLLNAVGANVSTSRITVTVTSLSPSPAPGKAPTGTLDFLTLDQGPGYQLSVKTTGYPAGTYTLLFTADTDPTTHVAKLLIS